jgi:hypothetical protein
MRAVRFRESEKAFTDGIAIRKQLAAKFSTVPEYRHDLAGSYNDLDVLLGHAGQLTQAQEIHQESLAINKQLADQFPDMAKYRGDLAKN